MADIIRLEDHRNRRPPPQADGTVGARLLLFTGVRYERLEPVKPCAGPGTKGTKTKSRKQG